MVLVHYGFYFGKGILNFQWKFKGCYKLKFPKLANIEAGHLYFMGLLEALTESGLDLGGLGFSDRALSGRPL